MEHLPSVGSSLPWGYSTAATWSALELAAGSKSLRLLPPSALTRSAPCAPHCLQHAAQARASALTKGIRKAKATAASQ